MRIVCIRDWERDRNNQRQRERKKKGSERKQVLLRYAVKTECKPWHVTPDADGRPQYNCLTLPPNTHTNLLSSDTPIPKTEQESFYRLEKQ